MTTLLLGGHRLRGGPLDLAPDRTVHDPTVGQRFPPAWATIALCSRWRWTRRSTASTGATGSLLRPDPHRHPRARDSPTPAHA